MVGRVADNVGVLFDCQIIMRRFLIAIPLLFMCFMSQAQTLGAEEIIEKINIATSQMESMECNFVQTKHIALLSDKMVSKGKMYYSQPDKLRWEYVTPYTYTFILNENQVLLKNSNRSDVIDVEKNKMFKEIARLMMNSIMGKSLSDHKSFDVTIGESAGEWVASLVPLKRDLKQMWQKLELHFDISKNSVVKVVMYEQSGDYTVIELFDIRKNKGIDEKIFNIE